MKSFIDCHCHAFNFVDIPMYLTLADKIKMGTIGRLKVAAGVPFFGPEKQQGQVFTGCCPNKKVTTI